MITESHTHILCFHVEVKAIVAAVSSDATRLESTEWGW